MSVVLEPRLLLEPRMHGSVGAAEDKISIFVLEVFFLVLNTTVHLDAGLLLAHPDAQGEGARLATTEAPGHALQHRHHHLEPAMQQPCGWAIHRVKEEASDEPLLLAVARRQQQLRVAEDPEDSHIYLKALLDSMNVHQAWEAHLTIGIEHSMHESGPHIDLTGGEGSSCGTVKEICPRGK
jgi:hypothetical protein